MSSQIETLRKLLLQGVPPREAIDQLPLQQGFHFPTTIKWIVRRDDLPAIPTAKCLAENLPPDRKPTSEEVDRAIRICSKKIAAMRPE